MREPYWNDVRFKLSAVIKELRTSVNCDTGDEFRIASN